MSASPAPQPVAKLSGRTPMPAAPPRRRIAARRPKSRAIATDTVRRSEALRGGERRATLAEPDGVEVIAAVVGDVEPPGPECAGAERGVGGGAERRRRRDLDGRAGAAREPEQPGVGGGDE